MSDKRDERTGRFQRQSAADRFWAKVNVGNADECWEWKGGKDNDGYGMFWMNGYTMHASRALLIIINGEFSPDLIVCHHCDNPGCVNPGHLFLGTYGDNNSDTVRKGRNVVTRPGLGISGEKHPRATLTDAVVVEGRAVHATGIRGALARFARQHNVNYCTLWKAVKGRTWSHL